MPRDFKYAIVHDWLPLIGGAEKVLESIHRLFPGHLHALMKNDKELKGSYFENQDVSTSFIQRMPFSQTKYRNYLPFFPLAVEQFDLRKFDVVISSSYAVAKGVLTNANQLHVCYCHSPIRYAWDLYHQYLEEAKIGNGIKGAFIKLVLHYLRIWDSATVNRVDYFIANSQYIADRIFKLYRRDAKVIYPPVNVEDFELFTDKEDFYFTASRMVPYKKIDLIVEAFSQMPDKKLVVIGEGPDFNKIKKNAGDNIVLLGYQPFAVLKNYMQKAKAFVFAAEEDFGIVPVEAQACGTPVIAYGKGGALETVIKNKTGVFFYRQTPESLQEAVQFFENNPSLFDCHQIRDNAMRFSKSRFDEEFNGFMQSCMKEKFVID